MTWTDSDASDGRWNWTCAGVDGGADDSCSASRTSYRGLMLNTDVFEKNTMSQPAYVSGAQFNGNVAPIYIEMGTVSYPVLAQRFYDAWTSIGADLPSYTQWGVMKEETPNFANTGKYRYLLMIPDTTDDASEVKVDYMSYGRIEGTNSTSGGASFNSYEPARNFTSIYDW